MSKVFISIITPSYNQASYLKMTLDSVMNQKGDDFETEYIVMDGGSTDESKKLLQEYEAKFKAGEFPNVCRFIWSSEKDKGQSDAINKGLKLSTGEIVAYLNSDDTYENNCFRKVVELFRNNEDINWVTGKCKIIDEKNREIRELITTYKNLSLKYLLSYFWLLCENPVSQPATFWKSKLHKKFGYFDENEHLVMDYEFWLRIGQKHKCYFLDTYLSNFRWYTQSKSGSMFIDQFKREYEIAKKYAKKKKCYLPIILHKINYWKIIFVYKIMSLLK